jgi:hypothetical protein
VSPALALVSDRSLADIESVLASALHRERLTVIDIGKLLLEAQRKVEHGQWLPWLERHFGKSERTAQNYMLAAEWAIKNATVADLKLRPSAIYWLARLNDRNGVHTRRNSAVRDRCQTEIETEIFALAKIKWIDKDDCEAVSQKLWVPKPKPAEAGTGKPDPDLVRKPPNLVKTPAEREAVAADNIKAARAANLRGMVGALIKLIPYTDDLHPPLKLTRSHRGRSSFGIPGARSRR